jgi:hypothetical protein
MRPNRRYYTPRNNDEIVFALGEVIAQLHYLVEQGRAKGIARNGKVTFACA